MKCLLAASAVLFASTLTAQVNESIEVRVVNVDVTVTSKGAPLRGLSAADFEIFEDGRPQKITNFYNVEGPVPAAAATAPSATTSVAPPAATEPDPRFRRKVLVLVDNRHTTRKARDVALRELETMINDRFHGEYEWSIGVIGRGITLILPLSSDKNAIHEALEIIRKSGTGQRSTTFADAREPEQHIAPDKPTAWSVFDKDYAEKIESYAAMDMSEQVIALKFTVPAYLDAVRGFASTSGRKVVLLMTGDPGFNDLEAVPHNAGNSEFRNIRANGPGATKFWGDQRTIEDLRKSVVQEANASDVSFYFWNVEGLVPEGGIGVASSTGTNLAAIFWLSKDTGGRLVSGNDPAAAVHEFDTASSSFYSLGYTPTHPDDGKYHKISVRLKRPGAYSLEYRTGYSDTPAATQLARAMTSPTAAAMQVSTLPVTLTMGTPATVRNEVTVPIAVNVPFSALQFLPGKSGASANLVVYVSVFDDGGKNLVASTFPLTPGFKSGVPDPKGTLVYRNAIKLTKGERHRIVVALRDVVTESVGMATEVVQF
jgi:VWFA-related protein